MKEFTRGAGILMSITSLPTEYGIGTLGQDAYDFVDLLVDLKQKYWQVLPLGPTSYGDSPYQSFSAFAGNPYMVDLNFLIEKGLLLKGEVDKIEWSTREDQIDYGKLFQYRFAVLKKAFERFDQHDPMYCAFCREKSDWLDDYSFFMAVKTFSHNENWTNWKRDLRDREEKAKQIFSKDHEDEIQFWKFIQFEFYQQWFSLKEYANKKGVLIIGDIPLYVALDSADVWANRRLYQLNQNGEPIRVAGCPPDAFSEEGQKWGNPLYDWEQMEKEEFGWWKKRIEASANLYDVIRIDHFIGIVRYYSIPAEDPDAKKGRWRKGPGRKLTDVIEKAVGDSRIIAEDLGVSVPGVKKLMERAGWPGMKILQFAFDGDTSHDYLPHNYEDRNVVVYAGTHDNETVTGYFRDHTEYELAFLYEYLNIEKKEDITDALIRLAYSCTANVVIFQMQDLLGLDNEARMNFPSTVGTNWRWRTIRNALSEGRRLWIRTMATIYRR